jgi:hypothetical protein
MKREILCKKCAARTIGKLGEYPGEHEKAVLGTTKGNYVCDHCMAPLPMGTQCHAFTIYTDSRPYSPWEHLFITETK